MWLFIKFIIVMIMKLHDTIEANIGNEISFLNTQY